MACNQRYDEWIAEYALGDNAELSEEQKVELRAHLKVCEACRRNYHETAQIISYFRDEPEWEVPEEILQETYDNVMRMIRRRSRQVELRRTLTWVSGALAASALAGLGLWLALGASDCPSAPITNPVATQGVCYQGQNPTPVVPPPAKSELAVAFDKAQDAKSAFALLQNAFDSAKQNPQGADYLEILSLCDRVISRWNETDQGLDARKLIARCHEQMGDPMQAHTAFLAYADEAGAREKQKLLASNADHVAAAREEARVVSAIILAEANRLFYTTDYMLALTYGDDLMTRYPQTEPARQAEYMFGEYCLRTRQPSQAVERFKAIIQEAPDGPAAKMAQVVLPSALFNTGRKAEASETWLNYGNTSKDPEEKALGYYNAGSLLVAQGKGHYAEAMVLAERVLAEYPQSRYVPYAQSMVAWLQVEIQKKDVPAVNDILKGKDVVDVLDL